MAERVERKGRRRRAGTVWKSWRDAGGADDRQRPPTIFGGVAVIVRGNCIFTSKLREGGR